MGMEGPVIATNGFGKQLYTKYEDFTGKFVLHCHLLDHEDFGMMEVVEVVE